MPLKLNYKTAALRVCLDQSDGGRLAGRVVSQRLSAPIFFSDVNNLVTQLDALMDLQKFPQAFQKHRSFSPAPDVSVPAASDPDEMLGAEDVDGAQGAVGTFQLYVSTRHNSTWQGFVDWLDGSEKQTFDSTLEFLKSVDQKFILCQK